MLYASRGYNYGHMSTVIVLLLVLVVLMLVLWLSLRKARPQRYNPSIFVDMDDQPITEIDFEAGIRANQKNPRVSHAD